MVLQERKHFSLDVFLPILNMNRIVNVEIYCQSAGFIKIRDISAVLMPFS